MACGFWPVDWDLYLRDKKAYFKRLDAVVAAAEHRPSVWPALKTAASRTVRDELSSGAMLTAFGEMARVVRQYDPYRIIITGNAAPRPCASHNSTTKEQSGKPDSKDVCRDDAGVLSDG